MIRRTTVDLDYDLLERARAALGCATARATIHEALQRAVDASDRPARGSAAAVLRDAATMHEHMDLEVLASDDMWR